MGVRTAAAPDTVGGWSFEGLEVNDSIRAVIAAPDFTLEKLSAAARQAGMRTMFEDGMQIIQLALTTIEEVLRVIRE